MRDLFAKGWYQNMKSTLGYILISACFLGLNGCASYEQKKYDSYLESAKYSLQSNEYYNAVNNAQEALRFVPGQEAKDVISKNLSKAIIQMKETVDKKPLNYDAVAKIDSDVNYLVKEATRTTQVQNVDKEMDDFNQSVTKYKNKYAENTLSELTKLIVDKNSEKAISALSSYIKAELPQNEKTSEAVKNLVKMLEEKNEIESIISLVETNKQFFSPDISLQIFSALYKDAKNSEKSGNYKKAIKTYKTISAIDKNAVDAINAVNRLLNEVTTIFTIAETGNASDESLSTSSKKIITLFADKLADKETYVEVASVKEFLAEDQAFDVDFDTIAQAKDIKFKPAQKVRYVILPKVTSIKINRSAPVMILKTANWDYNVDGNAFSIGAGMYSHYGGATVTHFEYTEGSERVNATQRLEFALYDTVANKVVLKTRVETRTDDSATWAENPMAVGIRNKVPASYYPSQISRLVSNNHSAASDDYIKNKLMELAVEQAVQKIKEKLSL